VSITSEQRGDVIIQPPAVGIANVEAIAIDHHVGSEVPRAVSKERVETELHKEVSHQTRILVFGFEHFDVIFGRISVEQIKAGILGSERASHMVELLAVFPDGRAPEKPISLTVGKTGDGN